MFFRLQLPYNIISISPRSFTDTNDVTELTEDNGENITIFAELIKGICLPKIDTVGWVTD